MLPPLCFGRASSRLLPAVLAVLLVTVSSDLSPARQAGYETLESLCDLPPDLEDARAHFLFRYTVDSRSEIRGVESLYAMVDPEEKLPAFITAAAQCVRDWGLGWVNRHKIDSDDPDFIALHFFRPVPENSPRATFADGRQVPMAWFDEVHDEKVKLAQTLMWGSKHGPKPGAFYSEFSGDGWMLRTDLKDPKDVKVIRDAVKFAADAFRATFPEAPPVSEEAELTVVFFEDRLEFAQVVVFDNLINLSPNLAGRYTSWDRMIYAAKAEMPRQLMARVLAHEATHHFTAQSFYAGNEAPPVWVAEGIASFIQTLGRPGDGGFDLAALDRGRIVHRQHIWARSADEYLQRLTVAAKGGKLPRLQSLLNGRYDDRFLSASPQMAYGISWLLVHYLVNAEDGKYRAAFESWLKGPTAEGGSKEFAAATGISLGRVQKALPAYIESLRSRAE